MTETWHGYIGIEDVALTAPQRIAIVTALQGLRGVDPQGPQHITHWRIRTDGKAIILEARFDRDDLTVAKIKGFLAAAVGVNPNVISDALQSTPLGPLVTFTAGGTARLRMIAFGGIGATWEESRVQALSYIAANQAAWEGKA